MNITYDENKNSINIFERGLSFELVSGLDWDSAVIDEDIRKNYGERRFYVLAVMTERLYAVIITPRSKSVHIISFRKANKREVATYERIKEKA